MKPFTKSILRTITFILEWETGYQYGLTPFVTVISGGGRREKDESAVFRVTE